MDRRDTTSTLTAAGRQAALALALLGLLASLLVVAPPPATAAPSPHPGPFPVCLPGQDDEGTGDDGRPVPVCRYEAPDYVTMTVPSSVVGPGSFSMTMQTAHAICADDPDDRTYPCSEEPFPVSVTFLRSDVRGLWDIDYPNATCSPTGQETKTCEVTLAPKAGVDVSELRDGWLRIGASSRRRDGVVGGGTGRDWNWVWVDAGEDEEPGEGLSGELFRTDGLGSTIRQDEAAPMRLRVQNGGDTPLNPPTIDGIEVTRTSPLGPDEPEPTPPELTGPTDDGFQFVLATEGVESLDFADFLLEAHDPGEFRIAIDLSTTDSTGAAVDATVTYDLTVLSRPLQVDITLDPPEREQDEEPGEDPEPVDLTVTIDFTNVGGSALEDITVRSFDVSRTVAGQPLHIEQTGGFQLTPDEQIDGKSVKDALAVGETHTETATFRVDDDGDIKFEVLAGAVDAGGVGINALGSAVFELKPKRYIGLETRVVAPSAGVLLRAGDIIEIKGTVTNLSNTATLELGPLYPVPTGNAGVMNLAYDGVEPPDPEDFVPPPPLTLDIGESRDFWLKVSTATSDPTVYGAAPAGGTRATLTFTPWGRATEPDGEVILLKDDRVSALDGDLERTISIDDSIELPGGFDGHIAAGILEGTIRGTANMAYGTVVGILKLLDPRTYYSMLRATAVYQQKVWDSFTEAEREAFSDNLAGLAVAVLIRNVEVGTQDAVELYEQVDEYAMTKMTELANEWETGDRASVAQAYATVGSEAIGSVVLPLALAKLARTPQAVAALERAQAALQARAAPLLARVPAITKIDDVLPVLQALENGVHLNLDEIAKLYGIAPDEVAEIQRLATEFNYLITVRSRHPSSIQWIRKFGALLKPEAFKIKSVSDLDARLGYSLDDVGTLVFKKPKPLKDFEAAGGNVDDHIKRYLQEQGFSPNTKDWDNGFNRVTLRIQEWRKHEATYRSWNDRGWIDTSFDYDGNGVPGVSGLERGQFTGFKMHPKGEDEFVLMLLDGKSGQYRRVTGDIDPIAFTHLDGSPLTPAEHKELLDAMRKSAYLAARHGESATFTRGGVDFILGQFKPNEPGLQFAPQALPPRVVRLDGAKSRWASAEDYHLHWEGGYVTAGKADLSAAPVDPTFNVVPLAEPAPAGSSRAFTTAAPPLAAAAPTVGRCSVTFDSSGAAPQAHFAASGQIVETAPDGTSLPSDLQTTCFSEGPTVPVTVAPATTTVEGIGVVAPRSAPAMTLLGASPVAPPVLRAAAGGPDRVVVDDGPGTPPLGSPGGFLAGQVVRVGEGTESELRTITSIDGSSLVLDAPLAGAYEAGTLVAMVEPAPAGGGGGGSTGGPEEGTADEEVSPEGAVLSDDAGAGDFRLPVASHDFEVGAWVVVGPGTAAEETAVVGSVEPLVLTRPLRHDHPAGTIVAATPRRSPLPSFGDVPRGAWFGEALDWAAVGGITTGTTATTFSPERTLTRAEFVTFLWRMFGSPSAPTDDRFGDVDPAAHYAPAVAWARRTGLVEGTSATTFSPADRMTRAQIALVIWRRAGRPSPEGPSPFEDVEAGSLYGDAVAWLHQEGLTQGATATRFGTQELGSRAQAVVFLHRIAVAGVLPPDKSSSVAALVSARVLTYA